jgi:hypothetical protein
MLDKLPVISFGAVANPHSGLQIRSTIAAVSVIYVADCFANSRLFKRTAAPIQVL